MSVAELMTQTIFGVLAILGILATLAGLHYRESLCCIWVQRLRRQRVQCTFYPCSSLGNENMH
jgi:uncharacterized integral membrane protein